MGMPQISESVWPSFVELGIINYNSLGNCEIPSKLNKSSSFNMLFHHNVGMRSNNGECGN